MGRPILDFLHQVFDSMFYVILIIAVILSTIYFYMSFASLFMRKAKKEQRFIEGKAPMVTVQIPTYNELAALRCAKKCLEFDYPKSRFEIIIGDDSRDKEISKRIDQFAEQHAQVKVTRRGSNKGYKAGNLNHMLDYSKGDVLVLFDSDFVPEKDFLRRIVTPFIHDETVSGVQARWKFIDRNKNLISILGSTIVTVFHQICLPFIDRRAKVSFLCGSAEAVRKKDLLELGKWETGSLTEDIEFSLRLLKNGKKIQYLEELECFGEVPQSPKDLYRQQMRWAYGVIYSFREHAKSLFASKKINFTKKFYTTFFCSGYLLSFLLLCLFATGTLSFITHAPGPLDLARFVSEMGINIALTSGLIVASVFTLYKTKNMKKLVAMIRSSFSYGLAVTYFVNVGIIKVMLNKPMQWYMLNKTGNQIQE
jgi:cellulose synthase/poly-beta-1,6-N-acetylglucosamine synthase-like glycosyltransferase